MFVAVGCCRGQVALARGTQQSPLRSSLRLGSLTQDVVDNMAGRKVSQSSMQLLRQFRVVLVAISLLRVVALPGRQIHCLVF